MAVDLRQLFLSLQTSLEADLEVSRQVKHAGTKGAAAEVDWRGMLGRHLPNRYQINTAFVVDSTGNISEQIDVVIHDRQFSPIMLEHSGALYVAAESVYAVLEIKPELDKSTIVYAGKKAASVRRLTRTSVAIPSPSGDKHPPKKPFDILAGILCSKSSWEPPFSEPFVKHLQELPDGNRLDLGCALKHGAFEVFYQTPSEPCIETSSPEAALIFFLLRLLGRLQELGNVPAIDFRKYANNL